MIALLRRRAMMMLAAMEGDAGDMNIKTGEFVGAGETYVDIEHGLGEIPFLFAFFGDEIGDETSGTIGGMWMNTGVATRYTSTISKDWGDYGMVMLNDGTNVISGNIPSSKSYGVTAVDENTITVNQYANNNKFISGKTYKWIAIADWR